MRRIGSEHEIEARRKRNAKIIGLFILFVLVIGTVGYGFFSNPANSQGEVPTDSGVENGQVMGVNGRWIANVNGQTLYFTESPASTENISVILSSDIAAFAAQPLYISSDNTAVINEIATTLGRYTGRLQQACYGTCEKDLPEKNCTENLIVWKDSSTNRVYQQDKCIFIEGDLRAVDAFLYKIFDLTA